MFKPLQNLPWNKPHILPWIILTFAAINEIFLGGKRRAFGSYVAVLRKDFVNITLTELNWIGDSYAAVGFMTSGLSTTMIIYFNRRYGLFQFIGGLFVLLSCVSSAFAPNPHWLFLTHTLFHGIGSSLIISIVGLVVNEHFDLKHPYHLLATTLISGGSVASIIFVTFFAYLIQQYNWRMAFHILGGIYFTVHLSGAIFFRKNDNIKEINNIYKHNCKCKEINKMQIPLLVLWFMDRFLTSVVTYGLLLNLTDYVHRKQPDLVRSTLLTTLFAAGEGSTYIIAAIITAATKTFFKNKLRYVLLCTSLLMSVCLIALEFAIYSRSLRRMLIFLSGFGVGPSVTFLFPAGEELTRLPGHIAYPFSLAGMGLGMVLSPLLTAKIAELFDYQWFFLVQGCLIFVKSMCLLSIILLLFFYKRFPNEKDYLELLSSGDEIAIEEEGPLNEETELLPKNS